MKYTLFASILAASVILSACMQNNLPQETLMQEEENTTQTEENILPEEEIFVSPLAAEKFLLPLENYSWEREFDTEYIIVHFTSAVTLSQDDPYNAETVRSIFEGNELSIHYIINRDGKIECYIPENRAAWHAGRGSFADDSRLTNAMNKYSVGIELYAIGSETDMAQYLTKNEYSALDKSYIGFTDRQYFSLKELLLDICERNDIPFDREHIIGHEEYNPNKSDPGELFEWERIFENQ